MNIFFDTSALVKIFHNEEGSEEIRKFLHTGNNSLYILDVAQIEYYRALYSRYRNHEISTNALQIAKSGFERELLFFNVESTSSLVFEEAQILIFRFGVEMGLLTLDSFHFAVFSLLSDADWVFVWCDQVLTAVSEMAGLPSLIPFGMRITESSMGASGFYNIANGVGISA